MSCSKCISDKCNCGSTLCLNPLIYLFKEAFSLIGTDGNAVTINIAETIMNDISKNNSYTHSGTIFDLPLALVTVLRNGISLSNNETLCCPDCSTSFYALGSGGVVNSIYNNDTPIRLCCIEHNSSVLNWNQFESNWINAFGSAPDCCESDFQDAIKLWIAESNSASAYFYLSDIIDSGLFESSSFNQMSGLGIIYNYIKTMHSDFTSADYLNILGIINHMGILVKCDGCKLVMGGWEAFTSTLA